MNSLLLVGLLGIASVLFTEVATAINVKLDNTVLKGDGAFLLSAIIAFIIAGFEVAFTTGVSFSDLPTFFSSVAVYGSQVWTLSQIIFVGVYQKLGLDLPSPTLQALVPGPNPQQV